MQRQRKARDIDDVVEEANARYDRLAQCGRVERGALCERLLDELRQVDRAEIARSIWRQRDLAAGIGRRDSLAIPEIVHPVDAIHEKHARLGGLVSGAQNLVPQGAGRNGAHDTARQAPDRGVPTNCGKLTLGRCRPVLER